MAQPNAMLRALAAGLALALSVAAAPARAQEAPPPPPFAAVDPFGVSLSSGTVQVPSPTISVGDPAAGGLSFTATWDTEARAWRSSIWGGIDKQPLNSDPYCYGYITVTVMGSSGKFQQDTCTGPYELKDGVGTLTRSGAIWTYTTPDGAVATYDYATRTGLGATFSANQGLIASITRPNGEIVTFTPATGGNFRSVVTNRGYQLHFDYDGQGLSKVTALNNAVDACAPTATSCTYSITWPSLTFATSGLERSVTDSLGRVTRLIFDDANPYAANLVGVARPTRTTGASVTYAYTRTQAFGNRVSSVSDGVGTWSYAYAYVDYVCPPLPDPCPPPPYSYAADTTVTAPDGGETVYHFFWQVPINPWDGSSMALTQVTDALDQDTFMQIDGAGVASITWPEGNGVYYSRDWQTGVLTEQRVTAKPGSGLADAVTTYAYPTCTGSNPVLCRRPTTATDPMGRVTSFTYDAAGNLTSTTAPAPTTGAVQPQTRLTWAQRQAWFKHSGSSTITQDPNPIWVQVEQSACATAAASPGCDGTADEVLSVTTYQTGGSGAASNIRPISVAAGDGSGTLLATTAMTYDAVGNILTVDGPLAGTADTTLTIYDAMRQTVGVIGPDPDGAGARLFPATKTTYNADGQPTEVSQGTTTAQTIAAFAAFSPLLTATTAYDAQGRKAREASAPGTADATLIQYGYDTSGRLSCVARRMNPATFASPPSSACVLAATGAFGPDRITHTNYDLLGHPTSVVMGYASGTTLTESQTFTANGKTATRTDGNGNVSTWAYDGFDRVASLRYPNASGGGSSTTDYEAFTYDAVGNPLTKRTRAGDAFTTTFDDLNRVTRIVADTTGARAVPDARFTYDNLGRRLTACFWVSSACTQTVAAAWDALGRQTSETGPLGTVTYGYDLAGRRTSLTWPDAFAVGYAWDLSNQVTTITQGSSTLASYAYDNLARRTGITRQNGVATTYGYDAGSRLDELDQNLAGTANDLALDFARNPASQLVEREASNDAYTYVPSTGTTAYVNNGRNQVTAAGSATITYEVTNGTLSSGNIANDGTTAFTYDAANRLKSAGSIAYAYDPLDRLYQESATATRRFLHAGTQLIGEYNTSNVLQTRYVPGPGVDEPLVEYVGSGTGTPRFYVADERGSIIARTTSAGAVYSALNTYDEYGVPAAAVTGRFQYTGQTRLSDTGLYYYKARVYAPNLGRFLQTDPIGYEAGLNLYAYVGNDPVNGTDPSGLIGPLKGGGFGYTVISSAPADDSDKSGENQTGYYLLGLEWLTGIGPRHQVFGQNDKATSMLRSHHHFDQYREKIASGDFNIGENESASFGLGGLGGIGEYLIQYAGIPTNGRLGNLAVGFTGSYSADYTVRSVEDGQAVVDWHVNNRSSFESATRPAFFGYFPIWHRMVNPFFSDIERNGIGPTGAFQTTEQDYYWTERIHLK